MRYKILGLLLLGTLQTALWAQRDDIPLLTDRQDFASRSIQELKNDGAIVLRLKTYHRKLSIMERNLRSEELTPVQHRRYQAIYDGTIKRRDAFNESLRQAFTKAFEFCPVYVVYDTSSKALMDGIRKGIFVGEQGAVDEGIELGETHIFIASFKERGSDFPYDVLRLQRLEEKLDEPFPYYVPIRESWVNDVNSPRAAKSVIQLDKKLAVFLGRALDYEAKKEEKAAKAAAKKS